MTPIVNGFGPDLTWLFMGARLRETLRICVRLPAVERTVKPPPITKDF